METDEYDNVFAPLPSERKIAVNINEQMTAMNKEFAVISRGNQVMILRENIDPVNESRDISFISKDSFKLLTENRWAINEKEKAVNLGSHWLKSRDRRDYNGVVFKPHGYDAPSPYVGKNYNLWRGFSYDPDERYIGVENLIFLDHIRTHVCLGNEEWFCWVIGWMADIFQRPHKKPGSAIILRGERRTGKGIIFRILGKLISRHYMAIMHNSQVTGRFNSHLADKILVLLDEAFWAGDKEAEGPLKSLVTEPSISVEMKGKDVQHLDSYLRIAIATNSDWAVPTGLNDENRFAVFDISNNVRGNTEYFGAMERQMDEGGYQAIFAYLLKYKYDVDGLRKAPLTPGLLEQKKLSLQSHERWLFEKLLDGYIIKEGDYCAWKVKILFDEVHRSYLDYCTNMKVRYPLDKHMLTKNIKQFIEIKNYSDDGRKWWKIPPLDEAREQFEKKIGHNIKWEE